MTNKIKFPKGFDTTMKPSKSHPLRASYNERKIMETEPEIKAPSVDELLEISHALKELEAEIRKEVDTEIMARREAEE